MKIKYVIFLMLISLYAQGLLFAQCCSPGSPSTGSIIIGNSQSNTLRILTSYEYRYLDQNIDGFSKTSGIFDDASFHFGNLALAYPIFKKTNITLEQGFFFQRKRNHPNPDLSDKISGLSNGAIIFDQEIYGSLANQAYVFLGLGLKYPLSLSLAKKNGNTLAQELQPSTNAFGIISSSLIHKGFLSQGIRIFLYNRLEYNFKNENNYRYGNLNSTSFYVSKTWNRWITLLQVRNEFKGKDFINDTEFQFSGSNVVYLNPEIIFKISKLEIGSSLSVPVIKYYSGTQLSPTVSFQFKIQKGFNLGNR